MQWKGRRQSDNIEDVQRHGGGGFSGGGMRFPGGGFPGGRRARRRPVASAG